MYKKFKILDLYGGIYFGFHVCICTDKVNASSIYIDVWKKRYVFLWSIE